MRNYLNLLAFFLATGLSIFLTGCSEIESVEFSKATLDGSITYKGKPLPYALVIVSPAGGIAAQGFADANGKFHIEQVAAGPVKIGVNTNAGKGNQMSAIMSAQMKGQPAPKIIEIPQKYFDPLTSGIETTISNAEGVNTYDIVIN